LDSSEPPFWFFWAALAWVIFVIALSVFYRRRTGRPIYPKVPINARYSEKWASATFANNCLMVWVTDDALSVVPRFPFNLMFLPEFYRLERSIPMGQIREVRRKHGLGNNVVVTYGMDSKELRLRVSRPDALIAALTNR
jgi:hypothetical protein